VVISKTITTGAALELLLASSDEELLLESDELVTAIELEARRELDEELASEALGTLDDTGAELLAGGGLLPPPPLPPQATNPKERNDRTNRR